MAKHKLALKKGHPTVWRKTVTVGTDKNPKRELMVFQPETIYEFSKIPPELERFIECGLLVDPHAPATALDLTTASDDPSEVASLKAVVAKQAKRIEELEKLVGEQEAQLVEYDELLADDADTEEDEEETEDDTPAE